jgi:hypothetical protein
MIVEDMRMKALDDKAGWVNDRCHNGDELNDKITFGELRRAIKVLKRGKAAGVDEWVNELIKFGGERMEYCLWLMFSKVWENEEIPKDWGRGLIFPLHKKDDNRDPFNYRGISLLSVVGKLFSTILNRRIMEWGEREGILADEQGGFRPGRGCVDQIFSFKEVLRGRKGKKTFCCFIDIKKAYDRVFRAGLWKMVWDKGIRGKMWRVLKCLYADVESSVLVNGRMTGWFSVGVGVRQGCVLSPILFAIFIDGVAEELRELGIGVPVEGEVLSLLMYADDIVLMAECESDLQQMLEVVYNYSKRWRFELSETKTEVVVFGGRVMEEWGGFKIGEKEVKVVKGYRYLGIEVKENLSWGKVKEIMIKSARRAMSATWGLGIQSGCMSVEGGVRIWKTMVRPMMEYAAEVWGDCVWGEAEKIQIHMGKRILGCIYSRT